MRQELRSSDVFPRMDLAQMLQAISDTNERSAAALPDDPCVRAYRAGFAAAVSAMSVAIGAQEYVQPVRRLTVGEVRP